MRAVKAGVRLSCGRCGKVMALNLGSPMLERDFGPTNEGNRRKHLMMPGGWSNTINDVRHPSPYGFSGAPKFRLGRVKRTQTHTGGTEVTNLLGIYRTKPAVQGAKPRRTRKMPTPYASGMRRVSNPDQEMEVQDFNIRGYGPCRWHYARKTRAMMLIPEKSKKGEVAVIIDAKNIYLFPHNGALVVQPARDSRRASMFAVRGLMQHIGML